MIGTPGAEELSAIITLSTDKRESKSKYTHTRFHQLTRSGFTPLLTTYETGKRKLIVMLAYDESNREKCIHKQEVTSSSHGNYYDTV